MARVKWRGENGERTIGAYVSCDSLNQRANGLRQRERISGEGMTKKRMEILLIRKNNAGFKGAVTRVEEGCDSRRIQKRESDRLCARWCVLERERERERCCIRERQREREERRRARRRTVRERSWLRISRRRRVRSSHTRARRPANYAR